MNFVFPSNALMIQAAFRILAEAHPDQLTCPSVITVETLEAFAIAFFKEMEKDGCIPADIKTLTELQANLARKALVYASQQVAGSANDPLRDKIDQMVKRLQAKPPKQPAPSSLLSLDGRKTVQKIDDTEPAVATSSSILVERREQA